MKTDPPQKHSQDEFEQDPLWDLLGEARPPKVDERFAGQMRQMVAAEPQEPAGWQGWLAWITPRRAILAGAAVLAIALLPLFRSSPEPETAQLSLTQAPVAEAVETSPIPEEATLDYETEATMMVALLPTLIEMEEESDWVSALEASM